MEKGRLLSDIIETGHSLGTNHPLSDYNTPGFIELMATSSRDDVIYGLKHVAKRGLPMTAESLCADLSMGIEIATRETADRQRLGETRQSYEPHAPGAPSGERKRRSGTLGAMSPGSAPSSSGGPGARRRRTGPGMPSSVTEAALQQFAANGELPIPSLLSNGMSDLGQQMVLAQLLAGSQVLPGLLPINSNAEQSKPLESLPDSDRPADALTFVMDLCRLAGQSLHPELSCAADLLRIWDLICRNLPWEIEHYTLPCQFYQVHIDALRSARDLPTVMTMLHMLWQRKSLHNMFSMYVSSLSMSNGGQGLDNLTGGGPSDHQQDHQQHQHEHPGPSNDPSGATQAMLSAQAFQQLAQMAASSAPLPLGQASQQQQPLSTPHAMAANVLLQRGGSGIQGHQGMGLDQQQQLQNLYYTLTSGDTSAMSPNLGIMSEIAQAAQVAHHGGHLQ